MSEGHSVGGIEEEGSAAWSKFHYASIPISGSDRESFPGAFQQHNAEDKKGSKS